MQARVQPWSKCAAAILLAVLLALMASDSVAADESAPQTRPITVEDVLRIEAIGAAEFSGDGRWLAYNMVPPYRDLTDFSYWLYANGLSGHKVWIKGLRHNRPPRLQPGLDQDASNYIMQFSPDNKHLVLLTHKLGHLSLTSCRIGKSHCTRFDRMPDIRDMYIKPAPLNERLVWTSSTTFLMPTRSADLPGSEMRSRGAMGEHLSREWNKAWHGKEPSASEVISTGRDRSEEWAEGELTEFDLETGRTRLIANGRFAEVRASKDKKYLVAARLGERIRPNAGVSVKRSETHPLFDRRYALRVIEAKTGNLVRIEEPFNIDPHSLTWSPLGDRFAVYGWNRAESSRDGRFYVVKADSWRAERISAAGYALSPRWSNPEFAWAPGPVRAALLGSGVAVFARPEGGDRYDWYLFNEKNEVRNLSRALAEPSEKLLFADDHNISVMTKEGAFRLNEDGTQTLLSPKRDGQPRHLAYDGSAAHGWANEFRFKSDEIRNPFERYGTIVYAEDSVGDQEIAFLDFSAKKGSPRVLELETLGAKVLAASREADAAVVTARVGVATKLALVRRDENPIELGRINEHLNHVEHPQTKRLQYTLNDPAGSEPPREVQGCLILPPEYREGLRYPVLIEVYPTGSPRKCETLRDAPRPGVSVKDLWAARGFIYMRPTIPLDLARMADDQPISGMANIIDQTVDMLIAQGYADPDRIVLYGFSQGGVSSLYTATQSDKFAAVVSMNGWADFFSHYFGARGLMRYHHLDQNGGDNRWRYDCIGKGADNYCPFGFGATPYQNPEAYVYSSPVALVEGVTAPVLLIHSDLDYIDMAQYDEMFGALYRAGKEARYVRYWGEGHGASSPANIRDIWRRIDQFLDEYVSD